MSDPLRWAIEVVKPLDKYGHGKVLLLGDAVSTYLLGGVLNTIHVYCYSRRTRCLSTSEMVLGRPWRYVYTQHFPSHENTPPHLNPRRTPTSSPISCTRPQSSLRSTSPILCGCTAQSASPSATSPRGPRWSRGDCMSSPNSTTCGRETCSRRRRWRAWGSGLRMGGGGHGTRRSWVTWQERLRCFEEFEGKLIGIENTSLVNVYYYRCRDIREIMAGPQKN